MAARTKSKVTPKYKTKYRVRNWAVYEESLRRRGAIFVVSRGFASESTVGMGGPGGQEAEPCTNAMHQRRATTPRVTAKAGARWGSLEEIPVPQGAGGSAA